MGCKQQRFAVQALCSPAAMWSVFVALGIAMGISRASIVFLGRAIHHFLILHKGVIIFADRSAFKALSVLSIWAV